MLLCKRIYIEVGVRRNFLKERLVKKVSHSKAKFLWESLSTKYVYQKKVLML